MVLLMDASGVDENTHSVSLCDMPSTKMFKRVDAMGVLRKLIRSAHLDRDERLADGDAYVASIIQNKIAGYYQALRALSELPFFTIASTIVARSGQTADAGSIEDESLSPQGDAQKEDV